MCVYDVLYMGCSLGRVAWWLVVVGGVGAKANRV